MDKFILRDYQEKAVDACMETLTSPKPKKSLVVVPTGGGKTLIIAETVKKLGEPVIVFQPRKELLRQNYTKFVNFGGEATIYCASLKKFTRNGQDYTYLNRQEKRCDEVSHITFGTIGSVIKEIETFKKMGVKKIIIDEIHLQSKVGSQIRKFIKGIGATHVVGLTATPIYLKSGLEGSKLLMINRSFATMFRNISHITQIDHLVNNGYWSPLVYKIVDTDTSMLRLNSSGADYTDYSLDTYYQSNNLKKSIVQEIKALKDEGRKRILVFLNSIQEAEDLYKMVPNSAVVHSKLSTDLRDLMVEEFTNGDIPVVFNIDILSIGYDNPEIDAVISARPTASMAVFYQQLGRAVRIHKDKPDCKIVDLSGNVNNFGKIEGITFEYLDGYGWGMFNEKEELLTDFPIGARPKPTKTSLTKEVENRSSITLTFGRYKGSTVEDLVVKDKGYLMWIYNEKDFSAKLAKDIKKEIKERLRLP